jgi:hypothetical protein
MTLYGSTLGYGSKWQNCVTTFSETKNNNRKISTGLGSDARLQTIGQTMRHDFHVRYSFLSL